MNSVLRRTILAAGLVLMSACGGGEEEADVALDAAQSEEAVSDSVGGMQGMAGMQDDAMMQQMQAHMQSMMGQSPDSMMAMMPQHRQMTANMLAQMNREMQQMNMAGDTAWTATADSLRQDLARIPQMSAQELEGFMPGHHARVTRLMEMHRSMMGGMGM